MTETFENAINPCVHIGHAIFYSAENQNIIETLEYIVSGIKKSQTKFILFAQSLDNTIIMVVEHNSTIIT